MRFFRPARILFLLIFLPVLAGAQPVVRPFDSVRWDSFRKELDYSADIQPIPQESREAVSQPLSEEQARFWSRIAKWSLFLLAALFLGFLLYRFTGATVTDPDRSGKTGGEIPFEELEKHLPGLDTTSLLEEAISRKAWNEGVRIYFLELLQILLSKGMLDWKAGKTNGEYLREVVDPQVRSDLAAAALLYESVWYGKKNPGEESFREMEERFLGFLRRARNIPGKAQGS